MEQQFFAVYALIVLMVSIIISHLAGIIVSRSFRAKPDTILNFMPSLGGSLGEGGGASHFSKILKNARRKVTAAIRENPLNVEAGALSVKLGESQEIIERILEEFKNLFPCNVKVTSRGRILYDFDREKVIKLEKGRLKDFFFRVFMAKITVLANISAVWPFAFIVTLGTLVAMEVLEVVEKEGVGMGIAVLAVFGLGLALILLVLRLLARLLALILYPVIKGPRILRQSTDFFKFKKYDTLSPAQEPKGKEKSAKHQNRATEKEKKQKSSWLDNFFSNMEFNSGTVFIILFACFVLAIGWIFVSLVIWFKNVFKAVWKDKGPDPDISPAEWTHREARDEGFTQKLFPGNDLIIRFVRSIKAFMGRPRPADRFMAARVLDLARQRKGILSASEIALFEEVGLPEAIEMGIRLVSRFGGEMDTLANGELVFIFDQKTLANSKRPSDLEFYFDKEEISNLDSRGHLEVLEKGAPINIPGISSTHLTSLYQLVVGAVLLTLIPTVFVDGDKVITNLGAVVLFTLPLIQSGVIILSGIFGYVIKASLANGFFRDAIRALIRDIKQSLEQRQESYDYGKWLSANLPILRKLHRNLDEKTLRSYTLPLFNSLGMDMKSLDLESGQLLFKLAPLYESKALADSFREHSGSVIQTERDRIIFESGRG